MAPGSKKAKGVDYKSDYKLHDVVLTKMRGYPPWPSWVTSEDRVPHAVIKAKPKVGKYVLTSFFNDNTYHWTPPRDVKPLTKEMINDYLASEASKKDTKDVRGAYEDARNPQPHIQAKESLASTGNIQEEEEAEGQDELEEEDEEGGETSAGAKRKRNKEKAKTKAPVKKQKKEKDSSTGDAAAPKPASSKKKPRVSEAVTEMGDDGDNEESMSPETKQVKSWRHQLQRAFLGKAPPKEADMPAMADIFKQVEAHQMSEEAYKQSKIGKVMKKITQGKEPIPLDGEYKFKERAEELCKKWKHISSSDAAAADSPAQDKPAPAEAKPASSSHANGSVGGAEQDKPAPAPKDDAKPEAAPAAA